MEIIMTISGYLPFANLIEKNMPFYIATIGNPKFQPPVHRPLGIEDYQLLYTEDGGGSCFINGKTFELCPGDIVYLPPNTAHEYFCGGDIWETIYITFNGSGMTGFFDFEPSVWRLPPDFDFKAEYAELDRMKKNPDCFKETSAAAQASRIHLPRSGSVGQESASYDSCSALYVGEPQRKPKRNFR